MSELPIGLDEIRQLYTDYLEQVHQADHSRKGMTGYMGFGPKLGDAPCHGQFAQDLEELLKAIARREPDSAAAREMLEYMYRAPQEHRQPLAAYWMLIAVHGLSIPLIARLDRADAQALLTEYKKHYLRGDRLPAQKKVLAALKRV